ncbi:MAG: CPBP family intramembrane metalloprotease, partial [Myxococcales bacterium]|nr:CPBP family intramembrane metalloprotease [Myxococcales bacterium]
MRKLITGAWSRFVQEPIAASERESLAAQQAAGEGIDWKVFWVCFVVALCLTFLNYFGMADQLTQTIELLRKIGLGSLSDAWAEVSSGELSRFARLMGWVGSCVFLYFVIPGLFIKLAMRGKLSDYGLTLKHLRKHLKIYAVLFGGVLPLVVAVSFSPAFQQQYPFYRGYTDQLPQYFWVFELGYAAQFFALEFFFRGFMVHGLKHRFGAYSVVVMAVPYTMIHFGKPLPETIGAFFAGCILGTVSLRTGSIWSGVFIHVSVAWTM